MDTAKDIQKTAGKVFFVSYLCGTWHSMALEVKGLNEGKHNYYHRWYHLILCINKVTSMFNGFFVSTEINRDNPMWNIAGYSRSICKTCVWWQRRIYTWTNWIESSTFHYANDTKRFSDYNHWYKLIEDEIQNKQFLGTGYVYMAYAYPKKWINFRFEETSNARYHQNWWAQEI